MIEKATMLLCPGKHIQRYICLLIIFAVLFCIYSYFSIYGIRSIIPGFEEHGVYNGMQLDKEVYDIRSIIAKTAKIDNYCFSNGLKLGEDAIRLCIRGPSIFFAETSGSSELNARQACSIESASMHNPNMSVTVLMTSDQINISNVYISILRNLSNVQMYNVDIAEFLRGTHVWAWYQAGEWRQSEWNVSHFSDGMRFFLMWKYGGVYLDLDVISLRSVEHLKNAVILEQPEVVASCMLVLDRNSALTTQCVEDFVLHYDKNNFAANGPLLITRNVRTFCKVDHINQINSSGCPINVLPQDAAFPLSYNWMEFFKPNNVTNIANYFNSSYALHFWNKLSAEGKVRIGENSLYEVSMREHCPLVYEYARKIPYL